MAVRTLLLAKWRCPLRSPCPLPTIDLATALHYFCGQMHISPLTSVDIIIIIINIQSVYRLWTVDEHLAALPDFCFHRNVFFLRIHMHVYYTYIHMHINTEMSCAYIIGPREFFSVCYTFMSLMDAKKYWFIFFSTFPS